MVRHLGHLATIIGHWRKFWALSQNLPIPQIYTSQFAIISTICLFICLCDKFFKLQTDFMDTQCRYEPPWQGRTVDSLGSAFGIQEAACSKEKAKRDFSPSLDGRGTTTPPVSNPPGKINLVRDRES